MMRKMTYERVRIRLDDYVAGQLEHEASLMPPGFEENAQILRQQAKVFRQSSRTEMLTIWKPVADE
jgi:hypothetical protein